MTLKNKVRELAFPDTTSMFAPLEKVKTKGALKSMKSTKCTPSMWKRINKMNTMVNSLGTPSVAHKDVSNKKQTKKNPLYWWISQSIAKMHPKNCSCETQWKLCLQDNCRFTRSTWGIIRQYLIQKLQTWNSKNM